MALIKCVARISGENSGEIQVKFDVVFVKHGTKYLDSHVGITNAQTVDIQRKKPITIAVTGF